MSDVTIPPPPYQTAMVNQGGIMSPAWSKWINQLLLRVGGTSASSTSGLQGSITTLQSNVTTLESDISTLNTSITTLTNEINSIGVGRQL